MTGPIFPGAFRGLGQVIDRYGTDRKGPAVGTFAEIDLGPQTLVPAEPALACAGHGSRMDRPLRPVDPSGLSAGST